MMSEIVYGKTPIGQIIYDLGCTDLTERYLARKHRMPIAKIRDLRAKVRRELKYKRPLKRA